MDIPTALFYSATCEWKSCFNTSKKEGQSYEINIRAVLAFREIGKGHNSMVTFSKILNMPAPPRRDNCTKIQNNKLLPVVKQCANDSMLTNAMKVREICNSDTGECGILMAHGRSEDIRRTMVL